MNNCACFSSSPVFRCHGGVRLLCVLVLAVVACAPVGFQLDADPGAVSLEQKIGQLLLVGFRGVRPGEAWVDKIRTQLRQGTIGGIVLYHFNIRSRTQLQRLLDHIGSGSGKVPAFIGVDQEGGLVQRLSARNGFSSFPSAKAVAKTKTVAQARTLYAKMARTVRKAGCNLNFAPVVDLDINPASPAIGKHGRSFSRSAAVVIRYAAALVRTHRAAGVLTVLKHFPGHGSARSDTHYGLADVSSTWRPAELRPYRALIRAGLADAVMTAHIYLNRYDRKLPASLSAAHIKDLLRRRLAFRGVVISDDLQMGAVAQLYSLEQRVVKALNAGSDILLFSCYFNPDREIVPKVHRIIRRNLKQGRITMETINRAFRRVLALKRKLRRLRQAGG